ncbi:hypothetical protein ACTQ2W_08395 [Ligilactobacillus ruminis]|uniref:hypothetical protein n=1 Tax=Ligilactobacillus ruminis TaxID=1623 RepID=UPI003F97D9E9
MLLYSTVLETRNIAEDDFIRLVILHEFNWNQIFLFLVPVLACLSVTGIISIPQRRIGQRTGFKFKFMESHRYD